MTKGYQYKTSNRPQKVEKKNLKVLQNEPDRRSESSSSTFSTTTTESSDYINSSENGEEEMTINIFDTLYDTSNESIVEEEHIKEAESLQKMSLITETNFFENFTELPQLADISEDISIATIIIEKESLLQDKTKDLGHFVDPLTGLELQNRLDSSLNTINDNARETMQEVQSVSETQETSDQSDIFIPEDGDFRETQRISHAIADEQTEDLFETFLELDKFTIDDTVEEFDWKSIMKQQEVRGLQQQTLDFLDDLIHKVVKIVEFVSPETILRRNLDKRKLMQEISNVLQQYHVELNVSQLINRKVVEYFKRKKVYRPITQGNVKNLLQEKENYMKALKHLDESLRKEKYIRDSSTHEKKNLVEKVKENEQKIEEEVQIFENIIRKYLYGLSNTQTNSVSEILLRKMSKYRKEVSNVRFRMINKQHNHALLLQKLTTLEELGNGLTIKDYDHMQTENVALDKKIEERNIDLKKLHLRSRHSLHLLAHFKEKHRMLKDVIETERAALDDLLNERSCLRKSIYQSKLKRARIHQEIKKLSIQGGLLDKPVLMYDYDQTEKRLNEMHEIVNRLRVTFETLQQKIAKLERRISTRNNHNFSMII